MSDFPDYSTGAPGGEPGPQYQGGPGPDQAQAQYAPPPQQYGVQPQYGVQQYGQPQGYAGGQGQPGQMTIAPRSPALGLIASLFIPGLGSMINGRVGIGITILGVYILGLILTIVFVGLLIAPAAWIWGMVDGYKSAQDWNRAHGIIS
jgi:TM2 domain-containing membrane protein YozV